MPSSSLVKADVGVEAEVGVEVEVGVRVGVHLFSKMQMCFRFNLDAVLISFTTYTGGWVVGKLEINAKLNSKVD